MATPRAMAMASPAVTQGEAVKPGWSAEMRFPRTIRLPVWVSNGVWGVGNGRREITIKDANQELHPLILTFLSMTPAYKGWLAAGELKTAQADGIQKTAIEAEPGETVTLTQDEPAQPDVDAEDKPASRRRKKSDD